MLVLQLFNDLTLDLLLDHFRLIRLLLSCAPPFMHK